jgi:L-lactate utilization protein LutB
MEKTPLELRYAKLGPKVAKALNNRYFEAWYFDGTDEAVEKVFSLIPKTDVVSWGGSMTTAGLNLQKQAVEKGYAVIDRDTAASPAERTELMRKALLCDTFLTGSNAISEDGQLVNIDGGGNRVAAMIFGPKQVIVVAGMNKVTKNLEAAMIRTRTVAAPANLQRFAAAKTPCAETGSCADCLSPDSICSFIVTTRLCKPAGRIKVILIGKDLGL